MGLSATSARIFLLTKENNSYELAAQDVSEERMILAKEQEAIANEYSDATSNMIYQCRVVEDNKGETQQQTMTLESLAKSQFTAGTGTTIVVADANATPLAAARAVGKPGDAGGSNMEYSINVNGTMRDVVLDASGKHIDKSKSDWPSTISDAETASYENLIARLNTNGQNSNLQNGIENGSLQLWVQNTTETANADSINQILPTGKVDGKNKVQMSADFFTRKTPDSMSGVTSRYYTEDDAAAQAHYQAEMTRTSALDTKLENKLNHIETQKKACEKEIESAESIKSSNVDRTFSYFGK